MNLYNIYTEGELVKAERDKLSDEDFGLKEKRMYPLIDAEHVRKAIQLFDKCDKKDRRELASRIFDKAVKFDVKISEKSKIFEYLSDKHKKILNKEITNLNEQIIFQGYMDFQKFPINNEIIERYAHSCPSLYSLRTGNEPIDDRYGGVIVVDVNSQVVGYIQVDTVNHSVMDVYVNPYYRHQGIASELLADMMYKYEIERVNFFKENIGAYKFFEKNGFTNVVNETELMVVLENHVFNEKDIYYNKDKFDSGKINLCFITGHSGSGKSTMGREMKGIEHYELDDLNQNYNFSDNDLKNYGDLIYSFFKGVGKKFRYYSREEFEKQSNPLDNSKDYDKDVNIAFVNYAKQYAKSHKDKKIVLEGIWLFIYFNPSEFDDYAFYIKGTSRIISAYRASKRDSSDAENSLKAKEYTIKNTFKRIVSKKNIEFEGKIKVFRKYFSNKENALSEMASVAGLANPTTLMKPTIRNKYTPMNDWDEYFEEEESLLIVNESSNNNCDSRYERPYSYEEIVKNYGKETADRLMRDPAHKWRAETGIELIHKEPSLEELNRIWKNWNYMSDDMKNKSDDKCKELFNHKNKEYYKILLKEYSKTLNESEQYETKLTKRECLNYLKDFSKIIYKDDFIVGSSCALFFHGVIDGCNDIDMEVTQEAGKKLINMGYKKELAPEQPEEIPTYRITINDRVECFNRSDVKYRKYIVFEGYKFETLDSLYNSFRFSL